MAEKDELGRAGEERARRYLTGLGWRVLAQNWRCNHGELDIVCLDGAVVVFVEVKTRRARGYGHPFEAITAQKLARLRRLAAEWMQQSPELGHRREMRIDAVAITGPDPRLAPLEHLRGIR